SLSEATVSSGVDATLQESSFSIGFDNLNGKFSIILDCFSLNELEDHDLDALVADLESKSADEQSPTRNDNSNPTGNETSPLAVYQESEPVVTFPVVTNQSSRGVKMTLMVDERQTVRDVLDTLFEKTHCESSIEWSLCETNPDLQIGETTGTHRTVEPNPCRHSLRRRFPQIVADRAFEDHECLVEPLSAWSRHSENKLYFLSSPQKYMMFTEPQEHFGGSTTIVPNLEGVLHLKEDGKKVWKPRYFMLRASGIYYVPKGKTKSSTDLACFVRFEKVNVYTASNYKQKYRAPTDFCFLLKHPCIQKESPYIKILCCEDKHTLLLWVNSIRIAKYGAELYKNYQAAVTRASALQIPYSAANKEKSNSATSLESPYP
ncbi:hypothetical protein CCH79_00011269, partial [Gambusia affinis]